MSLYVAITPFWPTADNLHGSFIFDQVAAILRSSSYDRAVVFHEASGMTRNEYEGGKIVAYGLPVLHLPGGLFNGILNPLNRFRFRRYLKKLNLPESEIKVIHAHCAPTGIFAEELKKRAPRALTVLQHHDLDPFGLLPGCFAALPFNRRFRALNARARIERADLNVCISEKVKRNLLNFPQPDPEESYRPYQQALTKVKACRGARVKRVLVLINGVDQKLFFPLPRDARETFDIGCVANFISLKRQLVLIRAVEQLIGTIPAIRLHLLGQGPLKEVCREYVRKHRLESFVDFPAERRHEELNGFFNNLDLFVLPSVFEGFGCVLLEAAACGIPFIACRNQGIECVLTPAEQEKWLVPPDDAGALARAIAAQYPQPAAQRLNCKLDLEQNISEFLRQLNDDQIPTGQ